MGVTLNQVLDVQEVDALKALGSYIELKHLVEQKIGLKLGVQGWNSFFNKISTLRAIISSKTQFMRLTCEQNSLREAKRKLTELLALKIFVTDKQQLKEKLERLIQCFNQKVFDPYQRFEETKLKNFKNSSKLEGIFIDSSSNNASLESVIAKYRRP